mgnify:CR=1 FL=1
MKVGIIGLGYVGLPLAIQFAKSKTKVIGFDLDLFKVDSINSGKSYIRHIISEELSVHIKSNYLEATIDFNRIKELDAIIICVPTPLNNNQEPDISFVTNTAKAIAPYMQKGIVVSLESTTYPGTTEDELKPILEKGSGLKAGNDFYLVYSPEREDPGNPESKVSNIPKVIGGYTKDCLGKGVALYSRVINTLVPVSNCRIAEATKLTENIFRSVNIALVNELKVIYEKMGIDIWEVINAAKTKPFGYMPFYPGPGLGGHCIPIDPFYLSWKARQSGTEARFIELAGIINNEMPAYVISRVSAALNSKGKKISNSQILLIGIAYKANVDDDRESPSYVLMDKLEEEGASVDYYDPFVPVIKANRKYGSYEGRKSIIWNKESLSIYDCALISTAHKSINYKELVNCIPIIVDTRNAILESDYDVENTTLIKG